MSRDKVIGYLWPEAQSELGRRSLSDSAYRINDALGGDVIITAGDEIRLNSERLSADLIEFEDALRRGDHEAAVAVYTGPFLEGFFLSDAREFERWIDGERDRLARSYASALEALAESAERDARASAAAAWWRQLAVHDPLNSRIALRFMQALDAAGERAAAIQHARIHEMLLAQELEIGLDPAIQRLVEELRSSPRSLAPAAPSGPVPASADSPQPSAPTAPEPVRAVQHSSAPDVELQSARPTPVPASIPRRRPRRVLALAAPLVAAVILAAIALRAGRGTKAIATAPPHTIAVLPFENLSGDRDNQYFSDGMTEELITGLAKLHGLSVASRTSVFALNRATLDVHAIGQRLGVGAVVEGTVRKSGSHIRISAQLVNAATGYTMWSEEYDREFEDVFKIQQDISRAIVVNLIGALASTQSAPVAERSTQDPEAYDLYLKGRFAWHQRSRDGVRAAIGYFTQATTRSPNYARAFVGLGDAYAVSVFYDYLAPQYAYPRAEAAAKRALELDPTLAEVHATFGTVLMYYKLDWPGAEREYKRMLAIDPNYSTGHHFYANLLTMSGRFSEAEREFRIAQETDPLSLIANAGLGWCFYMGGKTEAAVDQYRRTLALNDNFELAHLWGGVALGDLGRDQEARDWLARAERLANGSLLPRLALAVVLARSHTPAVVDSARAIVREVESRGERGEYIPSYEVGKVYLALGDRETALRWLKRAVDERSHSRALFRVDPQLAPLRGDPRFEELARVLDGNHPT